MPAAEEFAPQETNSFAQKLRETLQSIVKPSRKLPTREFMDTVSTSVERAISIVKTWNSELSAYADPLFRSELAQLTKKIGRIQVKWEYLREQGERSHSEWDKIRLETLGLIDATMIGVRRSGADALQLKPFVLERCVQGNLPKTPESIVFLRLYNARGSFSNVYHGIYTSNESFDEIVRKVAVKKIKRYLPFRTHSGISENERAIREATTWLKLEHENVLPLIGIFQPSEDSTMAEGIYLASPLASQDTLKDYLKQRELLPRPSVFHIFEGVANGLAYLHTKGVYHGDLSANNILISDEAIILYDMRGQSMEKDLTRGDPDPDKPHVWIADFGQSGTVNDDDNIPTVFATQAYRAPELEPLDQEITQTITQLSRPYSPTTGNIDRRGEELEREKKKERLDMVKRKRQPLMELADVFSFGILAYLILTGKEAVWDHPDKGAAIRVGLFYSLDKQVEHDPEEKKQIDGEWEAAAPKQAPGDQTGQESPNLIGDRLFGLVKPCWSADPSQRPSMARLIQTYRDLTAAGGLEEIADRGIIYML